MGGGHFRKKLVQQQPQAQPQPQPQPRLRDSPSDRASNILYASPAFDITDQAVEKLNRNFKAKQTADAAKK